MLEKTVESPLDCKEIKPINPKGNQPWTLIGKTDAEAEVPILWPPNVNIQIFEKDPDAGKDWGQNEKRTTEDEMAGQLDGITDSMDKNLGKLPGGGEGQEGLTYCNPWGHKDSDTTEQLNNNNLRFKKGISAKTSEGQRANCFSSFTHSW